MKKFTDMTRAEKRVAVAKDTLKWLKKGKIKPSRGVVMTFIGIDEDELHGKSLQKVLAELTTPCQVCQRGGLLYSYVRRVNEFKVDGVIGGTATTQRSWCDVDKRAKRKLEEVFSRKQLALIEHAFEGNFNDSILSYGEVKEADDIYVTNPGNKKRFKYILNNIINNKGTFKL